jgi:hypothetical protein
MIHEKMQEKFTRLNLMTPDGTWKQDALRMAEETLLPPLAVEDLYQFLDTIAEKAAKNPYLHDALVDAQRQDLTEFYAQTESEKCHMQDVVIFAKALDNLTHAARFNDGVLESAYNQWEENHQSIDIRRVAGLPYMIKFFSVRKPIKDMLHAVKGGSIDPNLLKYLLPLNIFEATVFDAYKGNFGNAYAGWTLTTHSPEGVSNPKTGAGPATLSFDGKACQLHLPYGKEWNDLYSAWNVGFVADLHTSPYCFAKLLIPSVSGYQENPSEYIFNRGFALYATMNFMLYQYNDEYVSGETQHVIDWRDERITASFSKVNAQSAQKYRMLGSDV